jgi:hypothetical protein
LKPNRHCDRSFGRDIASWARRPLDTAGSPGHGGRPVFGGHEVGIGFSGSYTDHGAVEEATALAGKRSIRFRAVLKKLAEC